MLTRRQVLIAVASAATATVGPGRAEAAAAAPQPATPVRFTVPAGACDTHTHVFGDQARFPYASTSRYRHPLATPDDLQMLLQALHVDRVVIIQPSGYGTDNSCTLDGVRRLGSRARGVVAIADTTSDTALDEMDGQGVRGIRVNIGQTPEDARPRLDAAVRRVAGRGWHVNIAPRLPLLEGLSRQFSESPVPIVIDHFAGARASLGVQQPGFDVLLDLLRTGKIYLKVSRIHNVSTEAPDYTDVAPLGRALIAANPQRILWATDWPHAGERPPGYSATDISPYKEIDDGRVFNQFAVWAPDPGIRHTILVDNPARLYGF